MARTVQGLSWQRTSDAVRAFVTQCGSNAPRRAIFCTYDIDVERFEAILLAELTRRGRQFRTLVAADAGALQSHLRKIGQRKFGRFEIAPVRNRRRGAFHPKMLLMQAGPHYLVGIGSANLTSGGLGGNLELMLFATTGTEHGQRLVEGAASFVHRLLQNDELLLPESTREFLRITIAGVSHDSNALSDSLSEPLLGQMVNLHYGVGKHSDAQTLTILSPWHSAVASPEGVDAKVIRMLKGSFRASHVNVFTDGMDGRGPELGSGASVYIRSENQPQLTSVSTETDDGSAFERRPTRVHAKAYLIECSSGGGTLIFGSANCTQPALARSVAKGGNVELLLASKLQKSEVAILRKDLTDLFTASEATFTPMPLPFPDRPHGSILAGRITSGSSGTTLRLEAPSLKDAFVKIAGEKGGQVVSVHIRKGQGLIEKPAAIRILFKETSMSQTSDSWGGILWERLDREFIPFPVSVPLLANNEGIPDQTLLDLVREELGVWPTLGDGASTSDDEIDSQADYDDDVELLAKARHEGKLDRLAVAVSVLRRRILSGNVGPDYARARIQIFRSQIEKLPLGTHIKEVLLHYLHASKGNGKAAK